MGSPVEGGSLLADSHHRTYIQKIDQNHAMKVEILTKPDVGSRWTRLQFPTVGECTEVDPKNPGMVQSLPISRVKVIMK